jgi:environmental stress-induced protein Ves
MNGFDWRASIATIASDGPFSTFAGVDRVIVLLDGSGVRLQSDDGRIDHGLDVPLQPFAFDGDAAITCTRLGGESSDFNVMTRRAICHADVRVARNVQRLPPCAGGLLFAARGSWHVGEVDQAANEPFLLSADTGLWWDQEPRAWQLTPADNGAALLTVQVWPRTDWSNA